jgi:hypothetical protein
VVDGDRPYFDPQRTPAEPDHAATT